MTFDELYQSVKKKFGEHPEICLERDKLSIQITDVLDNAFYILWEDGKCTVEPFHYNDYNVCIIASQRDIELLFTERQYLFLAQQMMNIKGSFVDVMAFQRLLSYITRDNSYIVQEEIISQMLMKQNALREDLGIVMQSLQLLITNQLVDFSVKNGVPAESAEPDVPKPKSRGRKPAAASAEKPKKSSAKKTTRKSKSS